MTEDLRHLRDRITAAELELRQRLTDERLPRCLVISRFGLDGWPGAVEERWPCERVPGLAGGPGPATGFLELRQVAAHPVLCWEWAELCEQPVPAPLQALPVWVAARLGARSSLLLAAGEPLRPEPDLPRWVLARDHLRWFGGDPLQGWPAPKEGARHPQLPGLYDPVLRELGAEALAASSVGDVERVLMDRPGPSGPTPTEREAFRRLGADVLLEGGLAEAVAARHVGLRHATLVLLLGHPDGSPASDPGALADQAETRMSGLGPLLDAMIPPACEEALP